MSAWFSERSPISKIGKLVTSTNYQHVIRVLGLHIKFEGYCKQ